MTRLNKGNNACKNHIIFFSGGKSSFAVADYVKTNFPNDNIVLYFTDTMWESDDLYRFIYQAADRLELPLLTHSKGLNPLELMFERKLVFNNMIGDCSKILKIEVASNYLKKGIVPPIEKWRNKQFLKNEQFIEYATLYFGIGFEEFHRADSIIKNWKPFTVAMPLIDHIIDNDEVLKKYNLRQPILYDYGFSHNNCNARCVKAGHGHYKNLLKTMPDVFYEIMRQEHHIKMYVSAYRYITNTDLPEEDIIPEDVQEIMLRELDEAYRDYFYGKAEKPKLFIHPAVTAAPKYAEITQYSFMKKSKSGVVKPYPIRELMFDVVGKPFDSYGVKLGEAQQLTIFQFLENKPKIDDFDIGGCGCFVDYDNACPL
ncbi:phosphoadenosine phosphosulfate reductase family protein [Metabacillus fastidiosus]|uniref:phosphoadenosine phosphosulfate reductase domain-containing protein n=1 Tax=Metabacillus fastidiosus TaxID=1458 RepID=UPI003D293132